LESHTVPEVPVRVVEDGRRAVFLLLRPAAEDNAFRPVGVKAAAEVVGVQEQDPATAGRIPDPRGLLLTDSTREEEARPARARRRHDDPTLSLFGNVGVFDRSEAKRADVGID